MVWNDHQPDYRKLPRRACAGNCSHNHGRFDRGRLCADIDHLATILIGLVGGAVLALVYIIGFDALIEGIRGPPCRGQ